MKRTRRVSLRKILSNINLSEVEDILKNNYKYQPGKPGRPPLSPTGMFLSFILMFLRMESYRDYQAFLEKDQFWRRQLKFEQPPDIGSFTNFLKRIGIQTFEQPFTMVVQQLLDKEFLNIHTIAQDGSILEGNPDDSEGEWGWDHINERYIYGYKIHVDVDVHAELPVALTITRANTHDSTQFPQLYTTVKSYNTRFPTRYFLGDKAFDSSKIRTMLLRDKITPVIKVAKTRIKPQYPSWFQTYYRKRTAVERFFSRLKDFLDLKKLKVYGRETVQLYAYLICIGMLLIGYINHVLGYSPRSIKTFLRTCT
ncbi:MAG: transposase [Methanobacteriota archaeon]